ncbi:restriction endonuclease subunit S [Vibrio breoganii]
MALAKSPAEIVQESKSDVLSKHATWERVNLIDVAALLNGFAFKSSMFSNDPQKGIPLIRIRDVVKHQTNTYYSGEYDETYVVRKGDLLIGMDGDFNAAVWQGENALLNQRVCKISIFSKHYDHKFLSYVIQPYLNAIHAETSSVTVKHLSSKTIGEIPLPLPPLVVQKLIVEKIEELFSHIDAGVEGLKQAKAKLQQYRQSVLKDAVTGKLTEQWRAQNADKLEPADVFLDKILEERRICWEQKQIELYNIKGKLPKTDKWKEKYPDPKAINWLEDGEQSHLYITLEHLKYYSIYGPRFSSNDYSDDGVLVLRTSDIDEYGRVNRDTAPKLSLTENEYRKYSVSPGDFLITRTGSIGTLAIYNDDYKAIPGAYLLHYKLVNKYVNPEYIYFVFKSPDYQVLLTQSTTGIGRPNLNAPTLEAMEFLLPSKIEQDEIVNIVKEKLKFIEKSEKDIEITLKKAVLQKSSVLSKAFSGELVTNASGESARELLDKIILEKDSIVKTKPKRSTKRKKKVTSGRKPLLKVLNEQSEPLKPDELMQLAGYSSNEVEEFYIELAEIAEQVEQLSPDTEQIKNWPYEKESEIKLKLKG